MSHSTLRQQAIGIISVCKTALAGKAKGQQHGVDNPTIAVAQAILEQAKAALPDDKVLAAVSLEPPVSFWTSVQTAMEMVVSSLPTEEATGLAERIKAGRARAGI
jgi:hypothetical protein